MSYILVKEIVLFFGSKVILCTRLATKRLTVTNLLEIVKTTCDTLVTVAVESIKIDGSSTVNTGIYFGSLKDRLSVCIHDTRSSSTIRVDEVASLVSLIIRSFKITITKRCLKYREDWM